jgi:hypothetical protein
MQHVHVTQEFGQPVQDVFAYLGEHENLGPLFGAKVTRLSDGSDGTRNGAGSARELRIGPLPGFVETNVEVVPDELIRYRITQGGVLKDHEGVMRFSPQGVGSRLDYTIQFDGKVPGLGPVVKAGLTRNISKALRRLATRGVPSAASTS